MPRCNIDLNPSVRGNGSLTIGELERGDQPIICSLTKHESLEEEIDPAHNDHLRHHHNHLGLHSRHHAIHSVWICQRVWRCRNCVAFWRTVLEV